MSVSAQRPAGYGYVMQKLDLPEVQRSHHSCVSVSSSKFSSSIHSYVITNVYPSHYWPGDTLGDHLQFALKYDGVNLALLYLIFQSMSPEELCELILSKPTGMNVRRIWFFYEFLMDERLDREDLHQGNYVNALDEKLYVTSARGVKSSRHRVVNNLLGAREFCPVVRKTERVMKLCEWDIFASCEEVLLRFPKRLIHRALGYFHFKETKASFAIENEKIEAGESKSKKFVAALKQSHGKDYCTKEYLIELQNLLVDQRFRNSDYRNMQNYVGQSVHVAKEIIHYIGPKPQDIHSLMAGLIFSHKIIKEGEVNALVHAALISYGFVFLHPFEDGNGRIHRFLIHNILTQVVPEGMILPVSSVMLSDMTKYDASLEVFSKPLLDILEYERDSKGHICVKQESAYLYRYIDLTPQVEALGEFLQKTLEDELVNELLFLECFDKTKILLQDIVDLPNHLLNLFIRLCLENGYLSKAKRKSHFAFLSDDEVVAMEQAVRKGYRTEFFKVKP